MNSLRLPLPWIPLIACGLLGSFLLPWFVIFGERASGFAIGRLGEGFASVWIIPALAFASLISSILRRGEVWISIAAGLSPYALATVALWHVGAGHGPSALGEAWTIARRLAAPGAYLTLASGAALVVAASFRKRQNDASSRQR